MRELVAVVLLVFLVGVVFWKIDTSYPTTPKKQPYSCCGSDVCRLQHHHEK